MRKRTQTCMSKALALWIMVIFISPLFSRTLLEWPFSGDLIPEVYPTIVSRNVPVVFTEGVQEQSIIRIFNINGRMLLTKDVDFGVHELKISLHQLSAGVYFINIRNNAEQQTFKLFKR